jgi:hypothetical protein
VQKTQKKQFNIIRNDNSLAINGDPCPSKLYKVLLSYTLFPPRVYILPSGHLTWQAARFPRKSINRGFHEDFPLPHLITGRYTHFLCREQTIVHLALWKNLAI